MRYIRSFTLKDLSLESILKHLDLFIYHKDRIPQRHIDFLHRLYSKECYNEYTFSYSKTEECLLWFLSSHNKYVVLPHITRNIVERLQIVGSGITSLTLQETIVTENLLNSVICCVPHLSYLNLRNTNCSNNTLLCVQKMCPNLETLNVQGCNVTDNGMVNLCGNSMSLKNLNIRFTHVQCIGLHDILVGMPSLQCVIYDNFAAIFHYIFGSLAYFNPSNIKFNLTELIFKDEYLVEKPNIRDAIWTWTVLCPNVEKVHILFPVKRDVVMLCSRFSYLKEFEFKSPLFGTHYIDDLEQLTPMLCKANNLTTLKLSNVKLPSVRFVECLTSVQDLYLNGVTFTDFNEDEIVSKTTNLNSLTIKNLDLNMTRATYKFIALFISLSKDVTELVISNMASFPCDLIDIILNSMKNLIFIEFKFVRTKQSSSLVKKFFKIPTIQQIYIDGWVDHQNLYTSLEPVHFSTDTCTLAWRIMNDRDADDDIHYPLEDNNEDFDDIEGDSDEG